VRLFVWDKCRHGSTKGVDMRVGLLLLLLVVIRLSTDLGATERAHTTDLQPVIFAAALGSH
jgi:hypothetical protein